MRVILRYFEGCPNWETVHRHLLDLQARRADLDISLERVDSPEDAERLGFTGSPTVLVDGVDPFADPRATPALACRVYRTPAGPAGSPTRQQLVEAILGLPPGETAS